MSKGTSTSQEPELAESGNQSVAETVAAPAQSQGADNSQQSKPDKRKPKPKRTVPHGVRLMTAEQYLKRATKNEAVSDLIRKLHKTKIMSFADWEKETAAVLKKKMW